MSIRLKILLLFLSLYVGSLLIFTLFVLLTVRYTLYDYTLNYMQYQVEPLMDFYKTYYKNPNYYARLLAEDAVSRDMAVLLIDKRGRLVSVESFLEGDMPEVKEEDIKKMLSSKRGVGERYAYLVKQVGDFKLIFLGKLDRVSLVERRIIFFVSLLSIALTVASSLMAVFLVRKLLSPLSHLTELSRRISKGELDVKVEKSGRRDEFGLLEEAYADMVERLKGIILWQREFIRNITHALKTPLAYIRGQAELLQMGIYKEENLREIYRSILLQSEKMERLITQLITMMRLESQMPLKRERFGVNQLFAELEEEYEFMKKDRNFKVHYLEEDMELEGDKEYIKMALRNLLENAYKYTEAGGRIRLYYKDGCLVVEDSGIGMEHPERAGEVFYREETGREGSGLGLSIVKLVAQRSHMEMKVESKKGEGTRVSLCYNLKL